jgi:organic hydroperoxide reductase OsmC/OhrA
MQPLPHHYAVVFDAEPQGDVSMSGAGLPTLSTDTPIEFGGTGRHWSPETLFVGALGDCLALTFRGIARAWKQPWISMRCEAEGTLDRVDGLMQFTEFVLRVRIGVPDAASVEPALRALDRAERTCLIANSLRATVRLDAYVTVEEPVGELVGA